MIINKQFKKTKIYRYSKFNDANLIRFFMFQLIFYFGLI